MYFFFFDWFILKKKLKPTIDVVDSNAKFDFSTAN